MVRPEQSSALGLQNIGINSKDQQFINNTVDYWVHKGKSLDNKLEISSQLGVINEKEQNLVQIYLTQRLLRFTLYDLNSIRKMSDFATMKSMRVVGKLASLIDRDYSLKREALSMIERRDKEFIKLHFGDEDFVPRTIELAINQLISSNTVTRGNNSHFTPDPQKVNLWAMRWNPILTSQRENEILKLGNIRSENV